MKRTALTLGSLAALALLGGCATDGDYYGGGGSGYYGSYGYYDGYYGPDYYPGTYGYAYIPRGGHGGGGYRGGYRGGDHDRGRDHRRDDGQAYNGGQGRWNNGDQNRGNWNGGASQAARDADRAAHPQSYNAGGERITRGNFWRQNQGVPSQSMSAPQQAAPQAPPSGDGGGRGFRGRRDGN